MPELLKLAVVADIHHGEDSLTKRGPAALGLLDRFLMFASDWGADMVIDLGDRISDVDRATDRALLAEVGARFKRMNTPRAHLSGNHDVAFMTPEDNAEGLGLAISHRSLDLKGWHLVFWQADAFIPAPHPFRIRQSDLDWLEADLAATQLPTVIFTHVPLGSGSMLGNYWFQNNPEHGGYPNAGEARSIIEASGKVVLCMAGHVHWNSLNRINAVPYVTVQSLTESFTTNGEAAGAWTTLELGDEIRWRTHGGDPISVTLPLKRVGERWPEPLPPFRHLKRAWKRDRVLAGVRGLVFDLDGVLYRQNEPIADGPAFVAWVRSKGWPVAAVTNNARRNAQDYETKLARMGYDIPAAMIVTAGHATARHLSGRAPGASIFVAGSAALRLELLAAGLLESDRPDYVVAGIDADMPMSRLFEAVRHLRRGAQLIVTNPDRSLPVPGGFEPEAGAVQKFLEAAGGAPAFSVGKPHPFIFEMALDRLGLPAADVLMIGDTPETDIKGADRAGMKSALMETGNPPDGIDAAAPTVIAASLTELRQLIESAEASS